MFRNAINANKIQLFFGCIIFKNLRLEIKIFNVLFNGFNFRTV